MDVVPYFLLLAGISGMGRPSDGIAIHRRSNSPIHQPSGFTQFALWCLPALTWLLPSSLAHATSIVILRSPHGAKIVVAADTQLSVDSGAPVSACKIMRAGNYWTAISGLASEPTTHFNSYQLANEILGSRFGSLDEAVVEIEKKTMATLPAALRARRKSVGEAVFWREYGEGFDAHEEAIWGLESGVLRVVYVQFVLHRTYFGKLKLSPTIHKCPGDACPNQDSGFAIFLGHHKVIDQFVAKDADWPGKLPLESRAIQFVEMEIKEEPDCHCAAPITGLRIDARGTPQWFGVTGPCGGLPTIAQNSSRDSLKSAESLDCPEDSGALKSSTKVPGLTLVGE